MTTKAMSLFLLLLLAGAASASQDEDARTLRLRGSRIQTRDQSRETEIVLEGMDERRRNRTAGDVQMRLGDGRQVEQGDLYERQRIIFSGGSVSDQRPAREDQEAASPRDRSAASADPESPGTTTALGTSILLVGSLVGLALWARSRRSLARAAER